MLPFQWHGGHRPCFVLQVVCIKPVRVLRWRTAPHLRVKKKVLVNNYCTSGDRRSERERRRRCFLRKKRRRCLTSALVPCLWLSALCVCVCVAAFACVYVCTCRNIYYIYILPSLLYVLPFTYVHIYQSINHTYKVYIYRLLYIQGGTRWRSLLSNYAISLKVSVRFPMVSLKFFIDLILG